MPQEGGLSTGAQADRPGGSPAFLYGTVRNVALGIETRQVTIGPGVARLIDLHAMVGREVLSRPRPGLGQGRHA